MSKLTHIAEDDSGVSLEVQVQPKASRERIAGAQAGRLKVAVTAPPEDGKANHAVIKLLAGRLKIARSRISILRGHTSRIKAVHIEGVKAEEISKLIARTDVL